MTLFFVGEIISSDVIQRMDKQTGQVTEYLSVNVMMRMVTKEGKPKVYAEDIQLPVVYKDLVDQNVGKYIVIPYNYIQTKDKSYLFPDDKYELVILDRNPFEVSKSSLKKSS